MQKDVQREQGWRVAQGVPHPWDFALLEPPLGPPKTPLKTHTIYREPWWKPGLLGRLLNPAESVSGSPRDGSWEPPTQRAGRLQSGVNRDEGWQREKYCVFSQGGVFSPLSGAQAIQAVCVLTVSAWDISHIPSCSASQGNPRKGSGCSSITGSSRTVARVVKHPSFSKSLFLNPNSVLAQGLLWLLVLRMSPQPVRLTGRCHSSVNSSH